MLEFRLNLSISRPVPRCLCETSPFWRAQPVVQKHWLEVPWNGQHCCFAWKPRCQVRLKDWPSEFCRCRNWIRMYMSHVRIPWMTSHNTIRRVAAGYVPWMHEQLTPRKGASSTLVSYRHVHTRLYAHNIHTCIYGYTYNRCIFGFLDDATTNPIQWTYFSFGRLWHALWLGGSPHCAHDFCQVLAILPCVEQILLTLLFVAPTSSAKL